MAEPADSLSSIITALEDVQDSLEARKPYPASIVGNVLSGTERDVDEALRALKRNQRRLEATEQFA